jgi:hypothetical protein
VLTPGYKLCEFADDTCLIIPALNDESLSAEIDHIEAWALENNLTLNRKKSKEIIFVDTRRKREVAAFHQRLKFPSSRHSRFSASPSPMVYRRPIMSDAS